MKRSPTLHQLIVQALSLHNSHSASWFERASPLIGITDDRQAVEAANRYFRIYLGLLPQSTIEERECLTDNVTFDDWWRNFERYVIPTLAKHPLPDHGMVS
jgi:hypothetical protein